MKDRPTVYVVQGYSDGIQKIFWERGDAMSYIENVMGEFYEFPFEEFTLEAHEVQ